MSSDKGYIKLYRGIRDHWIWEDKPFSRGQAWIDLLMMVNHEEKPILIDGSKRMVRRGETITSILKLSANWGWSERKTKRFLLELEKNEMIRLKIVNGRAGRTEIYIRSYFSYQDKKQSISRAKAEHKQSISRAKADKQYTIEDTIEETKKKSVPGDGDLSDQQGEKAGDDDGGWGFE